MCGPARVDGRWVVVLAGVEDRFAEGPAGGGVDDADVQVDLQHQYGTS